MLDKRQTARFTVRKPAVLFAEDDGHIACRIINLSVGGARLELDIYTDRIANSMALLVADECLLYPCTVRWHVDMQIGIEFTGQPELIGDPAEEIRQAEIEAHLFLHNKD